MAFHLFDEARFLFSGGSYGGEELSDIVHVFDVSGADCTAISDMASGRLMITL